MDVFITGGTGFIGRAVVAELAAAGHGIVALNRSPEKDGLLEELGAEPLAGDLSEPAAYREAAGSADAVVHCAFDYGGAPEADGTALETLLAATGGRDARLVYTSGCWVVGDTGGEVAGDDYPTDHPADLVAWRVPRERRVLEASGGGRIASVVRPGMVYGRAGSLTARMFETAVEEGAAEHIGDGTNHWSMIHVDDLARLYRLVIERGPGGMVQAVDGAPHRVSEVAGAASVAAGAGGRTRSVPVDRAREKVGAMADALCMDQLLEAPAARALGWSPAHPSFVDTADLAFRQWRESGEG